MAKLLEMETPREGLEPVEEVVGKLKALLRRAESGELRDFAYAADYCYEPDQSREKGTEWGRFGEAPDCGLIGGLEAAKAEVVEVIRLLSEPQSVNVTEGSEDSDPGG